VVTKIAAIAWKDLRSIARNLPALVMMLVAPLALAGLLGFAFGGGDSFQIGTTEVVVANADEGPAGGGGDAPPAGETLVGILTSDELDDVLDVTEVGDSAAARRRVDDGDAAIAVVVPAGFTAALYGDEGATAAVELYANPTYEFSRAITESVVSGALLDFNGARAAAAVAAVLAGEGPGHDSAAQAAAARFVQEGGAAEGLVLSDRAPQTGSVDEGDQVQTVGLVLAGMMVFFLFFGASNVARTILTEDAAGTLPRMMTTPTSTQTVLGGKFVSVFATVAVQSVVLLLGGRLLFGIDWGSLAPITALTLVGAAVASGLALLIIGVVRTPGQAGAISAGVYLVLALLGGNFTGTATTAGTYATVQEFTPNGWLLRGWDAAMRGGGLAEVAADLVVPTLFAVAFFAVAVLLFRRRYA
jgi:ABC-2 type transport system permease protein